MDNEAALDALELDESIWDPSRLGLSASEVAENSFKFPKKRAKTRTPKAKAKSNADIASVSDHPVADATEVGPDTLVGLIITDPLFSDKERRPAKRRMRWLTVLAPPMVGPTCHLLKPLIPQNEVPRLRAPPWQGPLLDDPPTKGKLLQ